MGMGYGANITVVIEQEEISKLGLSSFLRLFALLEQHEVELDELASCIRHDDSLDGLEEEQEEEIFKAYEAFQEEFQQATGVGIELCYHSQSDHGDKYDQVDGGYFALDWHDVYQMTPQAKALKEKVHFEDQFFVTYG